MTQAAMRFTADSVAAPGVRRRLDDVPELPWLVADIGGTNARFGLVRAAGGAVEQVRSLSVADHPGPLEAAQAYLRGADPSMAPRWAALAVASAVADGPFDMTNSGWHFDRTRIGAGLGLDGLWLLNDFEALSLALPRLTPQQCRSLDGRAPLAGQPLAVIGPGTGLGVAGVVPQGDGWLALPGEGGHATLSAADELEDAVLQHLRRRHEHVSAERVLSGMGLPLLHEALAAVQGWAVEPCSAEQVVAQGLAGDGVAARRTLELFCALLGGFAGNVALTLGARGGLFIGGGIVPRLGGFFDRSAFRPRFEAKGRFRGYMRAIPTAVITDTSAALGGVVAGLAQGLAGRRGLWRGAGTTAALPGRVARS